ncbi:Daunorubicin/doxorubicin resistance ATP-binding protein DrrA [bacterium HR29]|jgi:ABC-type multidrug transport system ATPase subunit|nr:Daunorubicin/doxorubicin resistance ATP-binding protein DrrA [bacterium HR29]
MRANAQAPAVEARGVVFAYGGRRALDGLTLEVPRGSIFGLLGPNGSGKSTFLSLVAEMRPPPEGSLRVLGEPPRRALRRRVGVVFQENSLDPLMTPREVLGLFARLYGLRKEEARDRAERLLAAVGLAERADDRIDTLSGGMRRRLEAARALLHEPDLLVLDEPTTGVDAAERQAFWALALEARERGTTVLFATNDLAEADAVCELAAFVRDGRVVACGTPAELKRGLRGETVVVDWRDPSEEELAALGALPEAGEVVRDGDTVRVSTDDASVLVPKLFALAGRRITSVQIHPTTLADAYFAHVGGRVREREGIG